MPVPCNTNFCLSPLVAFRWTPSADRSGNEAFLDMRIQGCVHTLKSAYESMYTKTHPRPATSGTASGKVPLTHASQWMKPTGMREAQGPAAFALRATETLEKPCNTNMYTTKSLTILKSLLADWSYFFWVIRLGKIDGFLLYDVHKWLILSIRQVMRSVLLPLGWW